MRHSEVFIYEEESLQSRSGHNVTFEGFFGFASE
jgi:hypothetical protein